MAKKKVNPEEIVEKVVEETIEAKAEETVEVKAEETDEVKAEENEEVKAEETEKKTVGEEEEETVKIEKKPIKNSHFQHPDDLCDFVNSKEILILAIVAFDRFQALYYVEK